MFLRGGNVAGCVGVLERGARGAWYNYLVVEMRVRFSLTPDVRCTGQLSLCYGLKLSCEEALAICSFWVSKEYRLSWTQLSPKRHC